MASETPPMAPENAADPLPHPPQDMQAMRRKLKRFGIMIAPEDPLHNDPMNALADNVLADAVALLSATNSWNTSDALTAVRGKRKRMIENEEADEEEYMIATVLLAQEIKVMRQRRRIAQLETAITKLRENVVLAYEQMLAQDT